MEQQMSKNKMTDIRTAVIIATIVITIGLGYSLSFIPDSWIGGHQKDYSDKAQQPSFTPPQPLAATVANGGLDPEGHQRQQLDLTIRQLFNDSVQLMQIGHYRQALLKSHSLIKASPFMPEAHVNLGFIMINLKRLTAAERSFNYALDIKADQANAYYGLALVAEARADYQLALSAMRSYIHLTKDSQYLPKARAALWTWQEKISQQNSPAEPTDEQD
jgi:tetratricopeptide (TPR) repeat protein